jgi:predicted anti-sigma-YlaC factor YlaD
MDHESAKAAFMAYHDRELADGERRSLEEHLASCPDCRAEWAAYSRTVGEVSGLRVLAPPANFARQVTLAIEQRGRKPLRGSLSLNGMRIAILSLILIMLLFTAYLTYLFLFTPPETSGQSVDGATKHPHGDLQVIGPVKLDQDTEKKK